MGMISTKLRASAAGQLCTLRTIVCNHDPETTVLAHLPSPIKGMGSKGDDWHAVFACSACHDAMDRHSAVELNWPAVRLRALQETQRIWVEKGLLFVAGIDPQNPKTRPKKKHKWPSRKMQTRPSLSHSESDHE